MLVFFKKKFVIHVSRIFGHVSRLETHNVLSFSRPLSPLPAKMYLPVSKSGVILCHSEGRPER